MESEQPRSRWLWVAAALLLIIGASAYLRFEYLGRFSADRFEFGGDNAHHYNIARNIAHGRGAVTDFIFSYWFRHPSLPALSDFYPPGYHTSVAAAFVMFGESIHTARMTSLFWSLLSVVALFLLARELANAITGLIAAALWAINRTEIMHSVSVMAESQFAALFLLGAWLGVRAYHSNRLWMWALAAVVTGLAGITKGIAHPLFVALGLLALAGWYQKRWSFQHTFVIGAVLIVGYALPMIPWALETRAYFGKAMYSNSYFVLYADDWSRCVYETTPPTLTSYLREKGLAFALRARWHHLQQTLAIAPQAVSLGKWGLLAAVAGVILFQRFSAAFLLGLGLVYYAFLLLAAGGMFAWRERYLLPCLAIVCIFSARGLQWLLEQDYPRRWLRAVALLAVLLAGIQGVQQLTTLRPPQDRLRLETYERFADWSHVHVPTDAIFMGVLVQEIAYFTQRRAVMEPYSVAWNLHRMGMEKRSPSEFLHRNPEEIRRYDVTHVMIDLRTTSFEKLDQALEGFPGVSLDLIYRDADYPLSVYRITSAASAKSINHSGAAQ